MNNNYVGIMAGGAGTRFWPASRESFPKQFLDILGIGKSLLQLTYERFLDVCPKENIFIISNEKYAGIIKEQLPELNDNQILKEPLRRNTAPCIAYAINKIGELNPDANIIISPSDHLIVDTKQFVDIMKKGLDEAAKLDTLITLGIKPTRPDTGYGYIQLERSITKKDIGKPLRAKTFTEKPNLSLAEQFVKSGEFTWNSGMFIWNVKAIKQAFKKFLPDMQDIFTADLAAYNTPNEKAYIDECFSLCPNISIDFGIMEKANNVVVFPADFGWSDLGTWRSIYEQLEKDKDQNAIIGENVLTLNSDNCMVSAPNKSLVVLNEVDNLIVVESDNILLVMNKDKEQTIKQVLTELKTNNGEKFL